MNPLMHVYKFHRRSRIEFGAQISKLSNQHSNLRLDLVLACALFVGGKGFIDYSVFEVLIIVLSGFGFEQIFGFSGKQKLRNIGSPKS